MKWVNHRKDGFPLDEVAGLLGGAVHYKYLESHTEQTNCCVVLRAWERTGRAWDNRDLKETLRSWKKKWEQVTLKYWCLFCLSEDCDTWYLYYGLKLTLKHLTVDGVKKKRSKKVKLQQNSIRVLMEFCRDLFSFKETDFGAALKENNDTVCGNFCIILCSCLKGNEAALSLQL